MIGMTPARAQAAVDDLIALAHAVKSGSLEADTKAFLAAAKKSAEAEKKRAESEIALKKREDVADRKEKSNERASGKIKSDREALKMDRDAWDRRKTQEQDDLLRGRTRLNNDAAAVKDRDQKARNTMSQAQTMMDAARDLDKIAKAMKADYQCRIERLEAAAKGVA